MRLRRRDDVAALPVCSSARRPWLKGLPACLAIVSVAILASTSVATAQRWAGNGATGAECPQSDLGSALPTLFSGTTVNGPLALAGFCGGNGPEVTLAYTAPVDESYVISAVGADFQPILYALAGSCVGEELACNASSGGTESALTVNLTAGQRIVIVVDSFLEGGRFDLKIVPVDTMLPALTALSFPSTLDLSTSPAAIPVTYTATDDSSGVAYFDIAFTIPGAGCGGGTSDSAFPPTLSRTAEVSIDLPQDPPAGVYAVCALNLCDAQDNCRSYDDDELTAAGLPTEVAVVGSPPGSPTATASQTAGTAIATATATPPVTVTSTPSRSATVTATPSPSPTGVLTPTSACAGDCGGDGEVTVDEIVTVVNIALGNAESAACPSGIPAGREADITLIIQGVGYALTACPA